MKYRLDFDNVVLLNPSTTGECSDTFTSTSPMGYSPPVWCGTMTGQHSKSERREASLLLGQATSYIAEIGTKKVAKISAINLNFSVHGGGVFIHCWNNSYRH